MPLLRKKIQVKYMVQEPYGNSTFWLFLQPRSTPKRSIYDEEGPLQTPQPVADSSLISDLYSEEFDTIETNITENEPKFDVNTTNSDVESLKLFRHRGKHTRDWTTHTDGTPHCWEITKACCTARKI